MNPRSPSEAIDNQCDGDDSSRRRLRVLALTRYEDLGAASRYRFLQYLPALSRLGIDVDVHALLDNAYVSGYYRGVGLDRWATARSYVRRTRNLLRAADYDLVWMEKEALPYLPHWLELLLLRGPAPCVVDYDDAVFHNYDRHGNPLVRALLGRKHDHIMRHAATVVAGNGYIAERAVAVGAKRVEVLPTVVDLSRYRPVAHRERSTARVGWIGTPYTARYLPMLEPVFRQLREEAREVEFVPIGSGPVAWPGIAVDVRPWSEETEVDELRRVEIGVMPLPDNPFERGKSGLKLIQYMACGLPVVASPVGVNRDIVEPGVNGFLCETAGEWVDAIRQLAGHPELRRRMGTAGREKVERRYCLEVAAPKLARMLRDAAQDVGE